MKRDPALRGLGFLLDADTFRTMLSEALPDMEIAEVSKTYIRYKPAMNCLVRYSVVVNNQRLILHAKAHGHDAPVKLNKAMEVSSVPSPFGVGRFVVQNHGIVVSFFPNDRKLAALRYLAEPAKRLKLVQGLYPSGSAPNNFRLETLRYKPERRYVARLVDDDRIDSLLLKFYSDNAYLGAATRSKEFGGEADDLFPPWRAESGRHGLVAMQWLEGETQTDLWGQTVAGIDCARMAGEGLWDLHQRDCDLDLPERTAGIDTATAVALADTLGFLVPVLSRVCHDLAQRFSVALSGIDAVNQIIHGDFYADQVLVDRGKLYFLDTDEICRGDPYIDVGTFLAHLARDTVSGNVLQHQAAAVQDAFLNGYESTAGGIDHSAVTLRFAFALFQLAHHPFRACEPDWKNRIEAIVAQCDSLLSDYERNRAKRCAAI